MKDCCVLCGVETPYDRDTHIGQRNGTYVEGAGQLCQPCYVKTYGEEPPANPLPEAELNLNCPNCGMPARETLRGPVVCNWSCPTCGHEFET